MGEEESEERAQASLKMLFGKTLDGVRRRRCSAAALTTRAVSLAVQHEAWANPLKACGDRRRCDDEETGGTPRSKKCAMSGFGSLIQEVSHSSHEQDFTTAVRLRLGAKFAVVPSHVECA